MARQWAILNQSNLVTLPGELMAKETVSENLIGKANKYYLHKNIAKIKKIEPRMRVVNGRAFYSSSTGLDFEGVLQGGKFITFEAKETEGDRIPVSNIRSSQCISAQRQMDFGVEPFLLMYFKDYDEWYYLSFNSLEEVLERDYISIPIRFFRAFGLSVPFLDEKTRIPDYLRPEGHPLSNKLKEGYPGAWMGNRRKKKKEVVQDKINHTDFKERKKRIMEATEKGLDNAAKREENRKIIIQRVREKHGAKGRNPFQD